MSLIADPSPWVEGSDHTIELLVISGAFLALVLLASMIFKAMNNRLKKNGEDVTGTDFTLDDLRKLHASGQMSDEEFNLAKAMVLGRAKAAMAKPKAKAKTAETDEPSETA